MQSDPRQFHIDRPTDLREARPWHRYAHHINTLPKRLRDLAGHVDLPAGWRLLDYGCADVPYRGFFPPDGDYVTADLPGNPHATLALNADGSVPAAAESFDVVVSTQVLEHVADPQLYLAECFRVLRPGGRLLLSTHGTFIYHPDPVDYWRWTCDGLRRVVRASGFEVEHFEGIIGLLATGLQLVQDAMYWRLPRLARPPVALIFQTLMRIADRFESRESKDMNATVFGLIAVKPAR